MTAAVNRFWQGILRIVLVCMLLGSALADTTLPASGRVALDADWALLLDPDGQLDIATIARPEMASRFVPQSSPPKLGYQQGAAWLRFTLQRPATAADEWWLELDFPLIDKAQLFSPQADGGFSVQLAGDNVAVNERTLDYQNPLFRLTPPAGQAQTYYLRVAGRNANSFHLTLWTPERFLPAVGLEQLAFGFFLSVYLVIFLTNLWFYQATREVSYGWFSLFLLINLLQALTVNGYSHQYLLHPWPEFNEFLLIVGWTGSFPVGLVFMLTHMGSLQHPRPRWAMPYVLSCFAVALLFAGLMLGTELIWVRPGFIVAQSLGILILFGHALGQSLRGNLRARLLLFATALLVAGTGIRYCRNIGLIDPGPIADNTYYIGTVLFLLVMNYSVSRSYQVMREEKEKAQTEALTIARRSERELEERVDQRTQALRQSIQQVQESLDLERRAQAEQYEFLATVSHELRTPVAIIDMTAQNLAFDESADAETRARYDKILRATQRMSILLDNYLDESRFTLLRRGIQRRPCSPAKLMHEAMEAARLLGHDHRFQVDINDLPDNFICDPDMTRLVLSSLADNAVKYTPAGTLIRLDGKCAGRRASDGIMLQVIDEGPGFSPEDAARAFEMRYRGQNDVEIPGSGMGLALARRMIEMQGGTLTLSAGQNPGSCLTIWLPGPPATNQPTEVLP